MAKSCTWTVASRPRAEAAAGRSQQARNPREIDLQVLAQALRGGPAGAEHSAAGVLERSHQIQPAGTGHRELRQLRGRAVGALLVARHGDAVQIPAHEARGGALHVERAVAVPGDEILA